VEVQENVVEQLHHLSGRQLGGERSEADQVRKQNTNAVKLVGNGLWTDLQTRRDFFRQYVEQQALGLLLLDAEQVIEAVFLREEDVKQAKGQSRHRPKVQDEKGEYQVRRQIIDHPHVWLEDAAEDDQGEIAEEPVTGTLRLIEHQRPEGTDQRPKDD